MGLLVTGTENSKWTAMPTFQAVTKTPGDSSFINIQSPARIAPCCYWVDMADEAESAEEFEESVLQEQVEHLKKYVIKRTDIKGRGADYTDEEKTAIAKGTVRNEFRKRTGMSFQEFFANVKADSAAASA